MLVSIYRDGSDCTNGGVTSPARAPRGRAILAGPGLPELFHAEPGMPLLELAEGYRGSLRAVPAEPMPESNVGRWMFGGNFVWTSDSRFRAVSETPIPVHDRSETPELYAVLST